MYNLQELWVPSPVHSPENLRKYNGTHQNPSLPTLQNGGQDTDHAYQSWKRMDSPNQYSSHCLCCSVTEMHPTLEQTCDAAFIGKTFHRWATRR
mmetsp:Transcript_65330/g.116211  ORF Transcript_65330/g.116211 Transcript_65330/m.116211 type:complete len:94 (-) Transcript_65330:889-1170(-)